MPRGSVPEVVWNAVRVVSVGTALELVSFAVVTIVGPSASGVRWDILEFKATQPIGLRRGHRAR
jgi:hypothetical protein